MFRRFKIQHDQIGFLFKDDKFQKALVTGSHRFIDPLFNLTVEVASLKTPVFQSERLREIVKAGGFESMLKENTEVLDLRDWQRALIWIDGRFRQVLSPGLYAIFTSFHSVRIEVVDVRQVRFDHEELATISRCPSAAAHLQIEAIGSEHEGVVFVDGKAIATVEPGRHVFWRGVADVRVIPVDRREQSLDVNGQDLMTADKVTLRLNALLTFRIVNSRLALSCSESPHQSLYRATQLALRSIVGRHELDSFLADKEQVASEALVQLRTRATELGLVIVDLGVRDIILPGEMKLLMNRVIEAKKVAEANLISRREETAAIRSQANTAKLLDAHPTLMRMRELEVLEKVAGSSNLQVVLGDKTGLTDRLTRLV